MPYAITCPLIISVRVLESGVCVHIVWYVCDVLYVRVNCFVVRGRAVSRSYINVCNSYVFSVVNGYFDHLKFYVVCINGCSECYIVSNESEITCATWRCDR